MNNADATQFMTKARPPFERFYIYILLAFLSFCCADLGLLYFRGMMLPTKAPPARPVSHSSQMVSDMSDYQSIITRDPFNADHLIPKALSGSEWEGAPVPTSLPLELLGTIVNTNPAMSVATIDISGKKARPYQVGDDIGHLAHVIKIERMKVIFKNLENNRLEYVEIKEKQFMSLATVTPQGIQIEGNNISISRSEVMHDISNFNQIINQASAMPDFIPGSGGQIDGYKLVYIKPGSIFEKLGLKRFDVIKSVNGEPVNSPAKAMELYNRLKNADQVQLGISRNGTDQTLSYSIR